MKRQYGAHRGIGMALLAVIAAICIAACGGSANASSTTKSTTTSTTAGKSSSFTALRACLTKHGVTLPNRTGRTGGRGFFGGGTGTAPAGGPPTGTPGTPGAGGFGGPTSSKFAKALKACGGPVGGFGAGGFRGGYGAGGFGGGARGRHFRATFSSATLTAFVACVRKNGYAAMPEANTKTTTGQFFPASIEKNVKFQKASVKCASILRKAVGAVNPGGPNHATSTTTSSSSST